MHTYSDSINILSIGFSGTMYHINHALQSNLNIHLLIQEDKYNPAHKKFFKSVITVKDIYNFNHIKQALTNKIEYITAVLTRYEYYIRVAGAINEYYNFNGYNYTTAINFSNKFNMKKIWLKNKIPCADGVCVKDQSNTQLFLQKHKFPLILKTTSDVHSSFVYKIKSTNDLVNKINYIRSEKKITKQSPRLTNFLSMKNECSIVLEEMLSGIEVTVDSLVSNGKITHTPICQYILPSELNIDDSYLPIRFVPTFFSNSIQAKIYSLVEEAIYTLITGLLKQQSEAEEIDPT